MNPTVLGTKPKPSKGHSALALNEERILITKAESADGDCFWFLEVGFSFLFMEILEIFMVGFSLFV